MPDLTIECFWMCETCESWETKVAGSKPGTQYTVRFGMVFDPEQTYDYDYECDCLAGKHGKKCRHIALAKPSHCQWHGAYDAGEVVDDKCPKCGGPVRGVSVAV